MISCCRLEELIYVTELNLNNVTEILNDTEVKDEADKAQFANLVCLAKALQDTVDSATAILQNEGVVRGEDGEFYEKITNFNDVEKSKADARVCDAQKPNPNPGSDFDVDKDSNPKA